ncbi:hypothetical protein UFOVP181_463 [uncultured Caudovirales phage]|uniref:Uncharacterized protein n=1 Tax=uncultured Caudovirales phage TaxID=2100421 RepID=A0A6J5KX48_9CAUD|nr:hypothetical protein UFOVP57_178 [uncultured Caudovirales phage]CAB5209400.1 hypothetical protein UFOVP181_463 [uncultured Caudovirales phage]
MGTRSRIGVMHGDNVKSVYCHWDGYPEHNGEILQNHYDSVKANQLVALGDLSSLKENIGVAHAFSTFDLTDAEQEAYEVEHGESCTFYGRDRGEENTGYKVHTTFNDFVECVEGSWCEWYYILKDGVWYCGNIYGGKTYCKTLTPLADVLASYKEAA